MHDGIIHPIIHVVEYPYWQHQQMYLGSINPHITDLLIQPNVLYKSDPAAYLLVGIITYTKKLGHRVSFVPHPYYLKAGPQARSVVKARTEGARTGINLNRARLACQIVITSLL